MLTITTESFEDGIILQLSGSADIEAAEVFGREVMRATAMQPKIAILDLSAVTDISSLFAGHIVAMNNGLKHHNGRLVIAAPIPRVKEALLRMRINIVIPIHESVEVAQTASVA